MGGEHVRKDVETVNGIRWKGCAPFQGWALEGGGEYCVLGRVQGNMGDVDFEVLIRVGFASIAV